VAIDWTALAPDPTMYSGLIEYRVENNGLVRWRGTADALVPYATVVTPPEANMVVPSSLYFFTAAGLVLVTASLIYLGYSATPLSNLALDGLIYQGSVPPPYSHTLAGVQTGLADALRNIAGLRVYDFPSDRVETPAAVLSLPETPYDVTLGGRSDEWTFPLWVLVAKADDRAAYAEMVDYLEAEGPKSIRAIVEADTTLGGACDTVSVITARPLFATVAGTEFLAIEFTVEVYA
jgi:hypothetical protein